MYLNNKSLHGTINLKKCVSYTSAGLSRPREDLSPVRGVSTDSVALNTPMVKRVFRQGPYHITVPLQPRSLQTVGEYQAQHSTGGLSEGWGYGRRGPARHGSFVWMRDHSSAPKSECVYLRHIDKQDESPAKHLSLQPPGIYLDEGCCLGQQLLCTV